nr:tetratricopeptide repeat protein [Desulfobulbaceae bacterium]
MSFPFNMSEEKLTNSDFARFEFQFISSALELLPCNTVHFLPVLTDADDGALPENNSLPEVWKAGRKMVTSQLKPVMDPDKDLLFLPIWNGLTDLAAVAVMSAGSKGLYADFSAEWLVERSRLLSREYRRIKHWAYDSVSGLLNGAHLRSELDVLTRLYNHDSQLVLGDGRSESWHLFLIEVGLRASDADQMVQAVSGIGAYLDSLVGGASVYHLGVGVFGILWNCQDSMEIPKFGYALLRKLKRQKIAKVHIGVASLFGEALTTGTPLDNADKVLSEGWGALSTARERGVYAMCLAEDLKQGDHPFAPLPSELLAQLKKRWRSLNQFSLAVIEQDIRIGECFPLRVKSLAGEAGLLFDLDAGRVVVLLPDLFDEQAEEWIASMQAKVAALGIGSFSIGIASYPCPGFHKNHIPMNALKALVHTNFLGAGTVTMFSGVSLNISGDYYYNEGDLVKAIQEYRLGLNLDPENSNLLNSLGVIYAQLNNHKKAISVFEKATVVQPKDFMALVNLGFAFQALGDTESAIRNFEKANKINGSYFDLLLQLGQLYCQERKFQRAVKVLLQAEKTFSNSSLNVDKTPWERCEPWLHAENGLGHGLVYRYLGEAFKALGKNTEAMTYLQRAVRYNSRDANALNMLAELYIKESQGADIALSLCEQAIDIDGSCDSYWFIKGYILHTRQAMCDARLALLHCLDLNKKNLDALILLAKIYQKEKNLPQARKTCLRILRLDGTNKWAAKALKQLNQQNLN